jgi:rhodanese-related sulfurtransferase
MDNETLKNSISVDQLDQLLNKTSQPVFLIDLMSREEFARQHIPGAVNIPVEELKDRIAEIPSGSEIIVVCKRGLIKSDIALNQLRGSGFKNAKKVGGGTMGWFGSK